MLPPVFYVQQLEQILLRKLLSPPTPANPARFAFCPRRALMSVFNFFVRFFRSVFRAKPCPFDLARLRCAPLSFPAPRARPSRRICAYIHIQFFVLFFCVEPRPLISRVCAARPTHLHQYSVFVSPFHFRPRSFGSALVIFCFLVFPFFFDPYFRRFYDLFLRRKYLESLVGVIRRFGVRPRATKAKKFSGLTFSSAGL